jgi:hypothetical protein
LGSNSDLTYLLRAPANPLFENRNLIIIQS